MFFNKDCLILFGFLNRCKTGELLNPSCQKAWAGVRWGEIGNHEICVMFLKMKSHIENPEKVSKKLSYHYNYCLNYDWGSERVICCFWFSNNFFKIHY